MSEIFVPKIYQQKTINWMLEKPKCGLFLDMGLGKTVSVLTAIALLTACEDIDRGVLIIAPKRVVESVWEQEARKWEPTQGLTFSLITGSPTARIKALHKSADVHIISRDNIAWLCHYYAFNLPFDMVVIDESSSFKNHTSQRFKFLKKAISTVDRVVLLTGTPAPRGYINLWSQLYLLDGGHRLGRTITEYRTRFFNPAVVINGVVCTYSIKPEAKAYIDEQIKDVCISFQSSDWIDLPELVYVDHILKLDTKVMDEYNSFEREQILDIEGNTITALSAGALYGKLLQFANGAIYTGEDKEFHELHDAKIQELLQIIEEANGNSVLVAYTYQHDRIRLLKALAQYKVREAKSDKDIQDWNNGDIQVMIGHPASMGHGLNLQKGGHISVWFGLPLDLELYQQFNARLHRQGQKHTTTIHHLIAEGTADEKVLRLLKSKSAVQKGLMDSLMKKINDYTNS